MDVTLSSAEQAQLVAALTALLSPLDYPDAREWGAAVLNACSALFGADQGFFAVPLAGMIGWMGRGGWVEEAGRAYEQYYWQLDTALTGPRRVPALEVYNHDMVADRSDPAQAEIYYDWCMPNRLLDAIGMCARVAAEPPPGLPSPPDFADDAEGSGAGGLRASSLPLPAIVHLYHERLSGTLFGERGMAILRLLLPALKAGVRSYQAFTQHRAQLARLLDRLDEGVLVCDTTGQSIYESAALTRMLAAEPERGRVRRDLLRLAQLAGALVQRPARIAATSAVGEPAVREIRTTRARYRVFASCVGPGVFAPEGAVLVTLEEVRPEPLSDEQLRVRYNLTRREVQVARLVERGRSTPEIARALGVSTHTARHHVEHLRSKLGCHRAAEAGAALRAH